MSSFDRKSSGYDSWHKQRVANRGNEAKRKKKEAEMRGHHVGQAILSKEYLCNKFNLLRLVVLIVTMLLLFTCILYGVGSILVLSLDDFWCDDSFTWDEISNHNRLVGEATGVGNCYVSQTCSPLDHGKVFATDVNENALVVKTNIYPWAVIKLLLFFMIASVLLFLLIKYCLLSVTDCKKTLNGDWYVCDSVCMCLLLVANHSFSD